MTTTSMSDPLVGHVLDARYEVVAKLARGGMATVYRAHDLRLRRTVAIKVMHDGLGDDAEFARKFVREAESAAKLNSPHVVTVFDRGTDDGRPYIVMEYVTGSTLRHLITRRAPLDPLRALDLLEPIAQALAAAHAAGIVHRDVKPENVLISDRGQVKVADFGLARAVTSQTATASAGLVMGTVSYLPPELVTTGHTDSRGDVYSTGVVLFEMLTGRKPHTGDVPIQVAYSHVHNDVPPPSTEVAGSAERRPIPDYLDALVQACTRRNPAERPRDGRELVGLVREARSALAAGVESDAGLAARMWESVGRAVVPEPFAEEFDDAEDDTVRMSDGYGRPEVVLDTPPRGTSVTPVGTRVAPPLVRQAAPAPRPVATRPRPARRPRRTAIRRRRFMVTLALIVIVALGVGVFEAWRASQSVAVPVLTGMTQDQAGRTLQANDLTATFQPEYSDGVVKGQIIRVQPGSGQQVVKHSAVTAWVSMGPEMHPMPTVVGSSLADAQRALAAASLRTGKVTKQWDETVPAGTIVSASTSAGTQLRHDTAVDLVVSQGPRPIPIASWVGKSADDAQRALTSAGFAVTVTSQNNDTVAQGLVISQTPASGTGHRGDKITLVKSLGPVLVAVPDVRLKSESQARAALTQAGFSVVVQYATPDWLRVGIVSGEVPSSSTKQPKGSTITVYVS